MALIFHGSVCIPSSFCYVAKKFNFISQRVGVGHYDWIALVELTPGLILPHDFLQLKTMT